MYVCTTDGIDDARNEILFNFWLNLDLAPQAGPLVIIKKH
jgi:hypothetical protein